MINMQNVSFTRDAQEILKNISLNIESGKMIGIFGASGNGKTTLLRILGNIEKGYTGSIFIQNKNIKTYNNTELARLLAVVWQQYNLFPNMTVLQNCMQPLTLIQNIAEPEAYNMVYWWFELFGLTDIINKYPAQLSGGQRQRVAIIRALSLQSKIILLDEPTAALDQDNIEILQDILFKLKQLNITIIIVSHNQTFLNQTCDKLYELHNGILKQI